MTSQKEGGAKLLKVPAEVLPSIVRFSSTYSQREVDNYYNLVRQKDTRGVCQICLESASPDEIERL